MNIGIVTTSRADFGIYLPLLKAIEADDTLNYFLFCGGMHVSEKYGNSYKLIEGQGITIQELVSSIEDDDSKEGVSKAIGVTTTEFSKIWKKYEGKLDLIFVLGDRYEMFAAVSSIVPFNIPIAHLHGGETTLGAIDEKFRHAITCMSDFHFASHNSHAKKVADITGSKRNVHNVGSLGVDSILTTQLFASAEFLKEFNFDISDPYILITYHPETVALGNDLKIAEVVRALKQLPEKILCTLPNADTEGNIIRKAFLEFEQSNPDKIKCFENLGQRGYLTAMKNCSFMLGNTSSGIIEAASYMKPVLNVGDRQKGRLAGKNVLHVANDSSQILEKAKLAREMIGAKCENPYGDGSTAQKIINILKSIGSKR